MKSGTERSYWRGCGRWRSEVVEEGFFGTESFRKVGTCFPSSVTVLALANALEDLRGF